MCRSHFTICLVAIPALLLAPSSARSQAPSWRFGLTVGGTSLLGVVIEHLDGRQGVEATVGTWSFHDLSVSVAVRGYLGPSALRPTLGAGLWAVLVPPRAPERSGVALLARFPVGFDWRAGGGHYLGMEVNLSRALWIRRTDPEPRPMNGRLVPLPGLSYRHAP